MTLLNTRQNIMDDEQQQKFIPFFLLFLAILFGGLIRFYAAWKAGFPIVDGGMFYTMVQDLKNAHYILPSFTTYNNLQIPYDYPPLGFYLVAGISDFLHVDALALIGWLPAILSTLTIPAFYLLSKTILKSNPQAALATVMIALSPLMFEWQLFGGGLTRSLGALFAILVVYFAIRMFREKAFSLVIGTILTGVLVILSHPEWMLQAALTCILVWWFFGRNKAGTLKALGVGGGILLLTAPWWAILIARHGIAPFLLASQTSTDRLLFWVPFLSLDIGGISNCQVLILALIGAFICLRNKNPFLPIWLVLSFLFDLRSAPHVAPIQISMLASIALSDTIIPALLPVHHDLSAEKKPAWTDAFFRPIGRAFLGYLFIIMLVNSYNSALTLSTFNVLPAADRQAMEWVQQNTQPDSRFIVLGWQGSPWVSPLTEWFPALSERSNLTTVQGREWLPGDQHIVKWLDNFEAIQSCFYQDITCLETWSLEHHQTFNMVYLSLQNVQSGPEDIRPSPLYISLSQSKDYSLVYETPAIKIFGRAK